MCVFKQCKERTEWNTRSRAGVNREGALAVRRCLYLCEMEALKLALLCISLWRCRGLEVPIFEYIENEKKVHGGYFKLQACGAEDDVYFFVCTEPESFAREAIQ